MSHVLQGRARRRTARIGAVGVVVGALAAAALVSTGTAQAAARPLVAVPGSTAPTFVGAHRDSAVTAGQRVSVAVSLKLHNTNQLATLDSSVSTPGNAGYGHYLTPAQFAASFGPTTADVDSVGQFLAAKGLTVSKVSANRQVVDASGSASQVASAFDTSLSNYTEGDNTFFANDSAVSLPAGVAALVSGVSGLTNRATAAPENTRPAGNGPGVVRALLPIGGLSPSAYNTTYQFNQIGADGTDVTVGLWEFDGYQAADLTTYDTQYGLTGPAPTTVSVDGANYDAHPGAGESEVELDSELVHGVAPKADQLIYEAPNTDQGQIDMANQIVSEDRVSVLSISWGHCEQDSTPSTMTSTDNAFAQAVAEGISIYSASGDDGSRDCVKTASGGTVKAVDYPGSSPFDTSVGGTRLTANSTGVYISERGWLGSGGGQSTRYPRPSWQPGILSMRAVPDVASDANPDTGYSIFTGGRWGKFGGTSSGAPIWAGFTALFNQRARVAGDPGLGFANPALYPILHTANYATDFHDITAGLNIDFTAGTGYDEVTGLGTPIGDALTITLLGTTGGDPNAVKVTDPGNQTGDVGTPVSLQLHATGGTAPYTWLVADLPDGLSVSDSGLITGTPTIDGSFSVIAIVEDADFDTASADFTWNIGGAVGCAAPGQKLGNPGFESGNIGWAAPVGVIAQNGSLGEPPNTGTWNAWMDGYGTNHTDAVTQTLTIPAHCSASLSFFLHVDSAETTTTGAFDILTVSIGGTTLATFSNVDKAIGYTQQIFDVSSYAGQTITLSFSGIEDSSLQTSFVIDDTALSAS